MSITFLNGIANRRHHSQVRNRPRTMFFYGLDGHQKQTATPLGTRIYSLRSFWSNRWRGPRGRTVF